MKTELVLAEQQIAFAPLQKSLKLLGYDISQLPLTLDTTPQELLDLLRALSAADLSKASRQEKIVWQSKLKKFGQHSIKPTGIEPRNGTQALLEREAKYKTSLAGVRKTIDGKTERPYDQLKLGLVKFIAEDRSHGFVIPVEQPGEVFERNFSRRDGNRIPGHELNAAIKKNQLIAFSLSPTHIRPEARKLKTELPAFILNTEGSKTSTAYLLNEQYWEKSIQLTQKRDAGLATLSLEANGSFGNWHVFKCEKGCEKGVARHFGRRLITKFINALPKHRNDLLALLAELSGLLNEQELQSLFQDGIFELGQKSVGDIYTTLDDLEELPLLQQILQRFSSTLSKVSFVLWAKGHLPKLPPAKSQKEADVWSNDIIPSLDSLRLLQVLQKLCQEKGNRNQIHNAYEYLLGKGISLESEQALAAALESMKVLRNEFPEIVINETHFPSMRPAWLVILYQQGLVTELSEPCFIRYVQGLPTKDAKTNFIESLPGKSALTLYRLSPELSDRYEAYADKVVSRLFADLPVLVFDLESDGQNIREFAWIYGGEAKTNSDYTSLEDGIKTLGDQIQTCKILVGHNIKGFDLGVLARNGIVPDSPSVWDTYEMEMLLQPDRPSYGLVTEHTAYDDAKLAKELFANQFARLLSEEPDEYERIWALLDEPQQRMLGEYSSRPEIAGIGQEVLQKFSRRFFRPQPATQILPGNVATGFERLAKQEELRLLLAPELIWEPLTRNFSTLVFDDHGKWGYQLSAEKITAHLTEQPFLQSVLLRFIHQRCGKPALYEHLPVAIKLLVGDQREMMICDSLSASGLPADGFVLLRPDDMPKVYPFVPDRIKVSVVFIGTALHQLTSKRSIGDSISFVTLFDRLKGDPIWLRTSGGRHPVSITRQQCMQLGITELPDHVGNLWLEKIKRDRFQLYAAFDTNAMLKAMDVASVEHISWDSVDETKPLCFVVRPDNRKQAYVAEQKRVNPESMYRRLYWTYQLKLLSGLQAENPQVLLVQDPSESELLRSLLRSRRYFVPDTNASLARQLELLHASKAFRRIMIASWRDWNTIIAANHAGPLDIIWDSLPLNEIYQLTKSELPAEEAYDDGADDFRPTRDGIPNVSDTAAVIRLCRPLIDYHYALAQRNHPDSRLLLLDPRFVDYFGIEKAFGANSSQVSMWSNVEEYSADLTDTGNFFDDAKLNEEVNFDVAEAKDTLRQIFLAQDDPEKEPYQWRDYQHQCLDEILPARTDLLISLPTGAGKSLLFQGPALYRSGFTNRLSIVVTPLRALMEDQVAGLWDREFYNNVDYISGDKSQAEVRDIYRRIAGGELALLYITPERFRSRAFENALLTRLDADGGLEFAIFDEAHCISQWGQEFRPDYLNAGRKIADLSKPPLSCSMRKLLFSATISEQVFDEIRLLMPGIQPVAGTEKSYNPVREHIAIRFKHNIQVELEKRLVEVANYLRTGKFNPDLSRALVFVKSRRQAEEGAVLMEDILNEVYGGSCPFAGKVAAFHAGMDAEDRKDAYEAFKSDDVVLLFATKAFGMGMDIPNIHYVTHLSPPGTFEDFLQEVGRAGRNEDDRAKAGFNNGARPIEAICLTANNDFGKLKDQLHESRITWHEISDIKESLEEYISRFKPLVPDSEFPVAVPFNLYAVAKQNIDDDVETRFRLGLYWLERLKRIKLGYFTITHLEFDAQLIKQLPARLESCPDKTVVQVCQALIQLTQHSQTESATLQVPVASLRHVSKLSMEAMFTALIKGHKAGLIHLRQDTLVEPTKLRTDETSFCYKSFNKIEKYPAIRVVFAMARAILASVPANQSVTFEGDYIEQILNEAIQTNFQSAKLSWNSTANGSNAAKGFEKYLKDIRKKRARHAFTIIRILGKTKVKSEITKKKDANRKVSVRQIVFNGYHKKEEWLGKIKRMEDDCVNLLDHVAQSFFEQSQKTFNWADMIVKLNTNLSVQHLSDLFFILSILGYVRTNGLMPSGIEVYLESTDKINEKDLQSDDKKVFEAFEQTRKVRELKLIALQVLSGLGPQKQDSFIRKYFSCNSLESLLRLMESELPENSPVLKAFRAEAIGAEENRLNDEQRDVYEAPIPQHISVLAGPGSGKTHTLTLRVAKLVHHIGVPPDEILVLAYNRAVVSELKDRLTKLFNNLGYESLARRLKIFTFHGLAKKYCGEELINQPFDQWEKVLLNKLQHSRGLMLNKLGSIRHILVDEFQDITQVRINLLDCLRKLSDAWLFIIGDPNQSIYGYDRKAEGGSMSPWPYYRQFNERFNPTVFKLYKNHRSYPQILLLASQVLDPAEEHKELLPKPVRKPETSFLADYAQVIDNITRPVIKWEQQLSQLLQERVNGKPYRQIALLFRTNNEVYRGYQKVRELNLPNVRIRIQGSLPYEFSRIRECAEVLNVIRRRSGNPLPENFRSSIGQYIQKLVQDNPSWNQFYLRMLHAVILEYLDETTELQSFDDLLAFIEELTWRDDGQLYKMYEKYHDVVAGAVHETEIVLTTMHKVKGLEFDAVIIPPSFADLPLKDAETLNSRDLIEQIEEEKRLAFVAYTRARFRLIVFKYRREKAMDEKVSYQFSQQINQSLGIPVKPELQKLFISWGATVNGYNPRIQSYIRKSVRSGDGIEIKGGYIYHNGSQVGKLSQRAFGRQYNGGRITGLVVNEIVVWTYADTVASDQRNNSDFASSWCPDAKSNGLIYLVDFAGYGQGQ